MTSQVTALEKHECPACGAQAEWNPTTQKLVCPFCGTESPYQIDREHGQGRRARSGQGAARAAGGRARLADRAPQRPVPVLSRGHGVRSRARRPELRVLRLAGARGLPGDSSRRSVRRASCRFESTPVVFATTSAAGGGAGGSRRANWRSRRSSTRSRASISRTGRSTRRCIARGPPRRATTTTSTCRASTRRAGRSCDGSVARAGSRRQVWSTRSSTTRRCRARRECLSTC